MATPGDTSIHGEKTSNEPLETTKMESDQHVYPSGMKVVIIMSSLLLAMFLIALDRTIIATAIPHITDQFHSLGDIGWYGSAYMLTNSGMQLIFGRIFKFYNTKSVFLYSVIVFEIGSLICAVAPSSKVFIIGRAIAGGGGAGVFTGVMMIMVFAVPLHKRPVYTGCFAAVFGISSVIGPLLGGVFTDNVSWRWCFYINLPIGAVSILVIMFLLKVPAQSTTLTLRQQLGQLDPLGTLFYLPSIICLILALQWGGVTYAWSSARIIVLLTLFSLFLVIFIAIQVWKGESATIPPRIISQRSIAFGFFASACTSGAMIVLIYYLPIYFQAIKNASAISSGVRTIPFVLALVLGTASAGGFTQRTGYYAPPLILSPFFLAVGTGLLTTLAVNTGHAKWIGYQICAGFGVGLGIQQPSLIAQTVLAESDVSIGVALMFFSQQLSGAVFLAVAQTIFEQKLEQGLATIPGLDVKAVVNAGATGLGKVVPTNDLSSVLVIYNNALRKPFVLGCVVGSLLILGAVGVEWKSVKKDKKKADVEASQEKSNNLRGIAGSEAPHEKSDDRTNAMNAETSPMQSDEHFGLPHEANMTN